VPDKAVFNPAAIDVPQKRSTAVALTTQCPYCIDLHLKAARTQGDRPVAGRDSNRRGCHAGRGCHYPCDASVRKETRTYTHVRMRLRNAFCTISSPWLHSAPLKRPPHCLSLRRSEEVPDIESVAFDGRFTHQVSLVEANTLMIQQVLAETRMADPSGST
jgi:hypothetical protein